MSRLLNEQAKMNAVGEVLGGLATQNTIARKYGLSSGYLSILTARARNAICGSQLYEHVGIESNLRNKIGELSNRISNLEDKINKIFK